MRRTDEGGYLFLLWGITFAFIFLTFVIGYFPFFHTTLRTTTRGHLETATLALAEAGVEQAMYQFNHASADFTTNGWSTLTAAECDALESGETDCRQLEAAVTAGDAFAGTIGDFRVTVFDPVGIEPLVVAAGFLPSATSPRATQTIRVRLKRSFSLADRGAYDGDSFQLGHGSYSDTITVDSYDSCVSTSPTAFDADAVVGTDDGTLLVQAWTTVRGKVVTPPGVTVTIDGVVTGDVDQTASPLNLPSISVPPALTTADPGPMADGLGNLFLEDGETYTCTGDERYTAIRVEGGSKLIMDPGCRLYVDGQDELTDAGNPSSDGGRTLWVERDDGLEVRGSNVIYVEEFALLKDGVTSVTQKPKDFALFIKGAPYTSFHYSSLGQVVQGVIYQEEGRLNIDGGAELFGAVLVKTGLLSLNSWSPISIHQDVCLENEFVRGWSDYHVTSWHALNP